MHGLGLNCIVLIRFGPFSDGPGSEPFFMAEPSWFNAGMVRYGLNWAVRSGLALNFNGLSHMLHSSFASVDEIFS